MNSDFDDFEAGAKTIKAKSRVIADAVDARQDYDESAINFGAQIAANILPSRRAAASRGPLHDVPEHLLTVPGILGGAVDFYNATAPKHQPQFAVQTALAFGAVVLGRRWVTDQNNMSGLYFVNVGKTAAGKEHAKTTIERLIESSGLDRLIGPSGYTSAAGVFSALIDQPNHITIIDELGRVLQSSQSVGNQHKSDAQTIIMEVFGRQTSTLRPQGYSKMGVNKKQAEQLDKVVKCPSLTIMAMTTPGTLFENLSSRYVADGFLGRFLIVESHIGRQVSKQVKRSTPSIALTDWAKEAATAHVGNLALDTHEYPPNALEVPFSEACGPILSQCDADMIAAMDENEHGGLDGMFGRTKEVAQRLALIVAVSRGEKTISADSLQWAVDYATFYARRIVTALRRSMSDGPFEAACKSVFEKIDGAGLRGITERELARAVRPFANMEPRKRKEVLDALAVDRGVSMRSTKVDGQAGRPRMAWFAPES